MMNNATTTSSSFFQQFCIVFGFIYEFRSLVRRRAFGIQVEEEADVVVLEDDREAGPPEETNRAVRNSVFEKALSILPTLPASFLCITLPGLFALLQMKWQIPKHVLPSSTLQKWYIVCITSLITELVASIAQWIISAASGA